MVRRLVEREAGTRPHPSRNVVERRMRELEESRLRHTHPDDPRLTWPEIEAAMDAIFGEQGSPPDAGR